MSHSRKSAMPTPTMSNVNSNIKKTCKNSSYECYQPCLESYSYCLKHILEDPSAPFRQCCFIYNMNGRKCHNAAPGSERGDVT